MAAVGRTWEECLEEGLQKVNAALVDVAVVRWMSEKLGVQPWVVATLGCCWMMGFLLWGFTGELICTVTGLLYPTYASFKALENGQSEDVLLWLRYWTTYGALTLVDIVFYRFLVWVPFYHLMRILVVVWLFLPATLGANSIYVWVVGPVLRRYSSKIDAAIARSAEEVRGTLDAAAGCAGASEIRSVLRKAAAASTGYVSQDLRMEDIMEKELAKPCYGQLSQAVHPNAATIENNAFYAARARVSSPAPRCTTVQVPPAQIYENKENAASDDAIRHRF